MSVHTLPTAADADVLWQAKVHLAAALRIAVLDGLEEGIDNHFTMMVPGRTDQYLLLPFGLHWSEARASDLVVFNDAGETLEGTGLVELSAQCIHAPLHRIAGVKVVLHTHQPWATALNMLKNNRLLPASQTAAFFHNRIAYDDHYQGLAKTMAEGERLAALLKDNHAMFLKNHGVITVGDTIAQAYRRLYKLEKACRTQLMAMSSGQPLEIMSDAVVAEVQQRSPNDRHPSSERDRLYFDAMMRVLDRVNPGYAE